MLADVLDCLIEAVGHQEQLEVACADGACFDHVLEQREVPSPVGRTHQHDGEVQNFFRLNQRERLVQFVERAETAGQRHECVRILEQQHLAHEEVPARDDAVAVSVGRLFERQNDVDPDGAAAGLARAAVGGLHQSRAASRHHGESKACQSLAYLDAQLIVRMAFANTRRTEYRHARTTEMERAKADDEIADRFQNQPGFAEARMRPFEQDAIFRQ